jgi:hypothetical protein
MTVASSALAAGPYDGNYVGTQQVTVNNAQANCVNSDHVEIRVTDNKIPAVLVSVPLDATVAGDGAFDEYHSQFGVPTPARIVGKISGSKMEFDMGGTHCTVHVSATKQ